MNPSFSRHLPHEFLMPADGIICPPFWLGWQSLKGDEPCAVRLGQQAPVPGPGRCDGVRGSIRRDLGLESPQRRGGRWTLRLTKACSTYTHLRVLQRGQVRISSSYSVAARFEANAMERNLPNGSRPGFSFVCKGRGIHNMRSTLPREGEPPQRKSTDHGLISGSTELHTKSYCTRRPR